MTKYPGAIETKDNASPLGMRQQHIDVHAHPENLIGAFGLKVKEGGNYVGTKVNIFYELV